MKLTLARSSLLKALGPLVRIVERRTTIPILSNLALRTGEGGLTIKATDLDIEVTTRIDAEVEQPGETTLPASTFHDIVRKLSDGAQVRLELDGSKMVLRSGRSRFTLQTLPMSDFPSLDQGEMPTSFGVPADRLKGAFSRCTFAISNEETRYYLNGIYFHTASAAAGETTLRSVATDGHRLVRIDMPLPVGAAAMPGVIVPRKAVGELIKLAEATEGDITLSVSTAKIRAAAGETILVSKLIDGTFPDYARVIPTGNDKLAVFDREALAAAVDRVTTISSERGRAVKVSIEADTCTLKTISPDTGEAVEELETDYQGSLIEIGFNARYVGEVLGSFTGDRVQVALSDPGAPAVFTAPSAPDALVVLMPMRV